MMRKKLMKKTMVTTKKMTAMVKSHFSNAVCVKKAGKRLPGLLSKKELLSQLHFNPK